MDAMDADDNLSDASLIEDDDEEEELIIQTSDQEYEDDDSSIEEFHGFLDAEIEEQRQTADAIRQDIDGFENYEFDLGTAFPPDPVKTIKKDKEYMAKIKELSRSQVIVTEEKVVDMYKHILVQDVYYTADPITKKPIKPFSYKMEEFIKHTEGD